MNKNNISQEENKNEQAHNRSTNLIVSPFFNMFSDLHEFCWDPETSSKEISFSPDFRHAFLYEPNYFFRTIIANRPFTGGIHYFEIIADSRTEHELKIGVTT